MGPMRERCPTRVPRPLLSTADGGLASRANKWWVLGWVLPLALEVAHALALAPTYHVGSFDDDANYLMAAHVLANGGWLTSQMPSGATVVAQYLPGYPLLLVPIVWIWGGALWAPRALSVVCVALLYPLLWSWMGGRGVRPSYRAGVLGLLAMNLVLSTYATMVMAEAPFLVALVLTLFAIDAWERRRAGARNTWAWGVLVTALLTELVWLKEAGVGLVVGFVCYLLWRRRWGRAMGVTAGFGALLLPGLAARWLSGSSTVGARYAGEISNPGRGGLLHQLPSEVVDGSWSYLQNVLRQSVLPSGSPLPNTGPVHVVVAVIGATVPVFCIVGAVTWYRHHARAEVWMVGAYFLETLGYPYVNQRRVLLVLPLVTVWYVVGACAAGRALVVLSGQAFSRAAVAVAVVVAVLAAEVPTAFGFTTNYLYAAGQQGSEFAGSPAMALLRAVGTPSQIVETDYRGSVAYFTGHRTAWTAFTVTTPYGPFAAQHRNSCTLKTVKPALSGDDAAFLVIGNFNIPGLVDSPCLLRVATSPSTEAGIGAARLLSTSHDNTSVFELLGPGTPQPGLVDHTLGDPPSTPALGVRLAPNGQGDAGAKAYIAGSGGDDVFQWTWARPEPLSQVSVGSAEAVRERGRAAPVAATTVSVLVPGSGWRVVASATGAVGDEGEAPYLLAELPSGTRAEALRISLRTRGPAEVSCVNAIGAS
ncbi:MAG TPA: hypothetical protein VME20_03055 [Acidimicrobiales bacterium]|nr:hypothetical protein [Acidimicrobiales bacterium]